ncbi:FAD-dependent oxidoreductase [Fictibacillus enclensis]|uniref:FAD-dependent oxidoreductase n=1 Tax=Fictibacillus enclensis TaxID=1017270 RepID=UPI0025A07D07|nr:FAD-dependent oxidoreductase [Fictibacillus enclensis]MDM5339155.1 FAD-dependent oxidoreductase [Fictibacillus enclensis]
MINIPFNIDIPVVEDVDVAIVGGGPSGIAAALGAARNGARVVLIERYGFLGGTATASLVGPFMTSFSDDGETQLVKGVFDELVRRTEMLGGAYGLDLSTPALSSKAMTMSHLLVRKL